MDETVSDRVRAVIRAASRSQAAFAEQVGLAPDKLSKSLNGVRRFSSLDLALIAEATDVTVDWLLTGRQATRPAVAARTTAVGAPYRDTIEAITQRFTAAYDVLSLLNRAPALPPLPRLSTDELGYVDQGAELARWALDQLARKGSGPVSEQQTDELVASWERAFGVDVAVTDLPPQLDGLAWQADGLRLILTRRTDNWTRQRFTLAHELGHILACDAQELVADSKVAPGRQPEPTEVRANVFAANFLLPADELRAAAGDLTENGFARLVTRFGVSPSALAARLNTLGLIDSVTRDTFRRRTTAECHIAVEMMDGYLRRVSLADRERFPLRLVRQLYRAYEEGETTLRPLAALLQEDVEELHDLLSPANEPALSNGTTSEGEPVFQP
ncbi:helix-turn-helix domain-containing protein [Kitasatospora azatica]|uniref:helix-turn-helix domain-containing protein n=1 Tax=Kitasatospora azatica TaxID=58347 RepID=UPI000567EA5D|nr:XRE family transcriptional regulator [Kitasatospora azatica]